MYDEFIDVLAKAQQGMRLTSNQLDTQLHLQPGISQSWADGIMQPTDDQARRLAAELDLDPVSFLDSLHARWFPQAALPDWIICYSQLPQASNGYLLRHAGGKLAIVDPAGAPAPLLSRIAEQGNQLTHILITHHHADHRDAVAEVARAHPQARIFIHEREARAIPERHLPREALRFVTSGEQIRFGEHIIEVLITPGHTDTATCFAFSDAVFVGDVMFSGSVGRLFGPTATYTEQRANIRTFLLSRSAHTLLLPGHGPITTVGQEREHNPFFAHVLRV